MARGIMRWLWLAMGSGALAAPALLDNLEFRPAKPDDGRPLVCLPRAAAPPAIDGIVNDAAWQQSWRSGRFLADDGRDAPQATAISAAYDATNLYLAMQCAAADPAALKTVFNAGARNPGAWGDDCVEIKLSPDNGRTEYQFIVTPRGAFDERKNGAADWDPAWRCAAKIGASGYAVEMALPLQALGLAGAPLGAPLLFNAGRVDRAGKAAVCAALAAPYINLDRAPVIVLGSEAEYRALVSGVATLSSAQLAIYLDREQYPSFQPSAAGRIRILPGAPGQRLGAEPALVVALRQSGREIAVQRIAPLAGLKLDFDLPLGALAPGTYTLHASLVSGENVLQTQARELRIVEEQAVREGRLSITIPAAPAAMPAWPVTFGVPFPAGALDDPERVRLLDDAGRELPVQAQVTGRWSKNGSVRWLLLDTLAAVGPAPVKLTLMYGPAARRPAADAGLRVAEDAAQITVDTGAARFVFPKRNTPGLGEVYLDRNHDGIYQPAELVMRADQTDGPCLVDEAGQKFLGGNDAAVAVALESAGPVKACVRVAGWHVAESGARQGQYEMRYYAYAGLPYLRVYHTFIITAGSNAESGGSPEEVRYRDIAYSLPAPGPAYFFGTPKVNAGRLAAGDAGAYLLQQDDRLCRIYSQGVRQDDCARAEGWMSVGQAGKMLTMSVRDFWQNYPKEFEVTPQKAVIHFWPAHGEDGGHGGSNISVRTVYRNWFAHEGKLLDFKIPGEVLACVLADTGKDSEESQGAPVANAVGLAKTHELWLHFHEADWEQARARSTHRVFQANLTGVCDPEWVCASSVFGPMAARDPARYPGIERALDAVIAGIFRQHEQDRDYGMFNFGDAHHNWNWAERRWDLHRIWRNTHHGWTRWPWLMYARSGDQAVFAYADRNARHVADADHCHYAPKELTALAWPRGKIKGGICDYKGFVHWASGNRLCYNSVADSLLWHYYFTGDERSRTTAMEHGAALLADGRAQQHREGSGRATSACELYFHTWDNDYLDFLERTVERLLNTQAEDGRFPQWENFAPFLERYIGLTRSRRAMQAMARWSGIKLNPNSGGYHQEINVRAFAYLYTGDASHLGKAAFSVREFIENQYLGEDPRYQGMFIRNTYNSNLNQSYFMQWMPYYLYAANRHGGEPAPVSDEEVDSSLRPMRQAVGGTNLYVLRARLKQAADQPFTLTVKTRGGTKSVYTAAIKPLGGRPIEVTAPSFQVNRLAGAAELKLNVPADGAVEYDLSVASTNDFFMNIPITGPADGMGEVYRLAPEGLAVGDGQYFYFNVPADAEQFAILYRPRNLPQKAAVFDPAGAVVREDAWIGGNNLEVHSLGIAKIRERAGWSFKFYGKGHLMGVTSVPAMPDRPFYFTVQKEKLFAPSPEE